jgi:hypothetical protein
LQIQHAWSCIAFTFEMCMYLNISIDIWNVYIYICFTVLGFHITHVVYIYVVLLIYRVTCNVFYLYPIYQSRLWDSNDCILYVFTSFKTFVQYTSTTFLLSLNKITANIIFHFCVVSPLIRTKCVYQTSPYTRHHQARNKWKSGKKGSAIPKESNSCHQ